MKNRQMKIPFIQPIVLTALLTLAGCDSWNQYWWTKQAQEAHNNGDHKRAIELYKKLIELTPDDPDNYWDLGIVYLDMGEEKKALEIHDQLKKMGHDDYAQKMEEAMRSSQHVIQRKLKKDDRAIGF